MPLLPPRWRLVLLGVAALSLPVIAGIVWLILTGSFGEVRGLVPVGPLTLKNWRFGNRSATGRRSMSHCSTPWRSR